VRRRVNCVVAPLLGVALAAIVFSTTSGSGGYMIRAELPNAAGLRTNFAVKIGGVPVGKVTHMDLGPHDRAIATLQIDPSAAPVGRDARISIRPSNLLGEKYVDLTPGDVHHPAASGVLIPRTRTAAPTELDDLLDTFDPDTRIALAVFLSEQGKSLIGRGGDLALTLSRMPRALDQARQLVGDLGHGNRALGRLVDESDRILVNVARHRRSLGHLVDVAGGTFETLASRQSQLGETVRQAPSTIAQARESLTLLDAKIRPLGSAARGLRATAPGLTTMLRQLPPFVAAARPMLNSAVKAGPELQRLATQATPVLRRLQPATGELRRFSTSLNPVTKLLASGITDALGLMEGWARAIQNRDAAGHVYRVGLTLAHDVTVKLLQQFIAPSAAKARRHQPLVSSTTPSRTGTIDAGSAQRLPSVASAHLGGPTALTDHSSPVTSTARILDYLLGQ
jgi:phospholipid/cholesterol/gamma-HCH transport system substrate-binding protein